MSTPEFTVSDLNTNPDGMINWFDDLGTGNPKYRFLSNFYAGKPIDVGIRVRSKSWAGRVTFFHGEGAFQALKASNFEDMILIAGQVSPNDAKRMGRRITLRPDWEQVKYDVMASVIRSKFAPDRAEADMLLQTGDAYLVEGTFWRDQVWGVDLHAGDFFHGRNWLGTLLMARRAELRAYEEHGVIIPNGVVNIQWANYARPDPGAEVSEEDGTLVDDSTTEEGNPE